jgi:uncharacterized protein YecT (DUF1311 family)
MKSFITSALVATLGIAAITSQVYAKESVTRAEMPHHCKQKAALVFGTKVSNVSTLPAESTHGKFTVYGQTPAQGQNALFFTCTFNANGHFRGVNKTSDNRTKKPHKNPHHVQPSFDCSKASSSIEKLICSDNELAKLDRSLADLYKVLLNNLPSNQKQHLKAEQRGWVKGRNECWKSSNLRRCVKSEYELRIKQLKDR